MTASPFSRSDASDTPWPASWESPVFQEEEAAWAPPNAADVMAPVLPPSGRQFGAPSGPQIGPPSDSPVGAPSDSQPSRFGGAQAGPPFGPQPRRYGGAHVGPQVGWGAEAASTQPPPTIGPHNVAQWLDEQAQDLTHPQVVEQALRRAGWYPAPAAIEAARYRTRFNEHHLGYSALLVSTGLAALAGGTLGHILASGIDHGTNRNTLAFWLTALLVTLPFAVWAHLWAVRVDRQDPVAVWSRPRQWLSGALVWGCGIVGIARLMIYAAQLIGSLVGASWATGDSAGVGAINVALTVGIALPLGLWAFHFRHRFDDEDPTRHGQQLRRHSR